MESYERCKQYIEQINQIELGISRFKATIELYQKLIVDHSMQRGAMLKLFREEVKHLSKDQFIKLGIETGYLTGQTEEPTLK